MSEGSGENDPVELADAVFRVLSDENRRCVLYYLWERDAATVDELATVLTGWTQAREDAFEIATPDDRERVRAALHHVHLLRIADAGFVRYDPDSGEVALEARPAILESILEQALEEDRRAAGSRTDGGSRDPFGNEFDRDRTDSETDRDRSEDT